MASVTGRLGDPNATQSTVLPGSAPVSLNVTMPAGKCPYGAVTFSDVAYKGGNVWGNYWVQGNHAYNNTTYNWKLYLCDSAGNNAVEVLTVPITGSSGWYGANYTAKNGSSARATGLAGKALYLKAVKPSISQADLSNGDFSFRGVTNVVIEYGDATYGVTTNVSGSGGTLSANVSAAAPGATVTLTPSPSTGYQLSGYSTSPAGITITNNQFTMPSQAVTITATFSKITYTISTSAGAGGSLSANKSTANFGDTVTLTPSPDTGYQLSSYTKTPSDLAISNNQFTMPPQNVSIVANFTQKNYTVTVSQGAGGTLSANKSTAHYQDLVTLTPSPNTGYQLSSYTKSPTNLTITNNQFYMPDQNVSVTAYFSKINYTVTITPPTGGTVTASKTTANYQDNITLTATPNTGYQFAGYSSSQVTVSNNSFKMPNSNVVIAASFTKISYSITKAASPAAGGSVTTKKGSTSVSSANYQDTITVTHSDNSGYYFNGYTKVPSNLSISNNQFSMPAQNVSITANYLRRSTASLNKTTLEGGGTAVLTISTESTAYTHKYNLSFGTGMTTGDVSVAAGTTSVTINVPLNWSAQIPSATSKTGGTLTVTTFSGSTNIGTYQITGLTYSVPASVKPSMGTITTSIARTIGGTTYANVGNYYVQSHCGVRIQASASGSQSATITSLAMSIAGYSGTSYAKTVSSGSMDFTTGLLTISGSTTITITATDSRGRTNTATKSITVDPYARPSGSLSVRRVNYGGTDDDMGTYGKYTLTKNYSQVGSNSLSWTLNVSSTTVSSPADAGDLLPGNRKTFAETSEYPVTLVLTDAFETTTITATLPSARFIIYVDSSGNKIGFMKVANKSIPSGKNRTFEISADTQIYIGDSTLEDYIRSIH